MVDGICNVERGFFALAGLVQALIENYKCWVVKLINHKDWKKG